MRRPEFCGASVRWWRGPPMGRVPPTRSSIGAIILQLLGGIIPFVIFRWVFDISIWLSIVLAILVVGILMAIWETYLRKSNPV